MFYSTDILREQNNMGVLSESQYYRLFQRQPSREVRTLLKMQIREELKEP